MLTPSNVNPQQFGLHVHRHDRRSRIRASRSTCRTLRSRARERTTSYMSRRKTTASTHSTPTPPVAPLWHTSFIDPANGITASAVVRSRMRRPHAHHRDHCDSRDRPGFANALRRVSKVKLGPGSYQQQLHALDIATGLEQMNSPVTITAQRPRHWRGQLPTGQSPSIRCSSMTVRR